MLNLVQDHCNPLYILSSVGEVYESDWVKGRENVLWTGDVRQKGKWTDGQPDQYRAKVQGRALIK